MSFTRIIQDVNMVEQVRFPRSKKRRIRKKWKNRPENYGPSTSLWMLKNGTIICHPIMVGKIRAITRKMVEKVSVSMGVGFES